jgi:hypothetical protein
MQQTLAWIVALAASTLLVALLGTWALRWRTKKPQPLPTEWNLSARPVFSTDERRAYRHLREALPHHIVLAKLPLVRFSQPNDPQQVRYWYELLSAIHVTFAVCSANGRVLVAIDLDNDRATSRRAQQIKENVLAACQVRYRRFQIDRMPSVPELQLLVPQTVAAARAPLPASAAAAARDTLPGGAAARRRERKALWQDSGFFQDSFFGAESRSDSGQAAETRSIGNILRSGVSVRELDSPPPDDAASRDAGTPPTRH